MSVKSRIDRLWFTYTMENYIVEKMIELLEHVSIWMNLKKHNDVNKSNKKIK